MTNQKLELREIRTAVDVSDFAQELRESFLQMVRETGELGCLPQVFLISDGKMVPVLLVGRMSGAMVGDTIAAVCRKQRPEGVVTLIDAYVTAHPPGTAVSSIRRPSEDPAKRDAVVMQLEHRLVGRAYWGLPYRVEGSRVVAGEWMQPAECENVDGARFDYLPDAGGGSARA